jgi:glycosyltransferase involved in cell wall biosynthesis
LATRGFETVEDAELSLRWLWRAHSSVGFLHVHWPEGLYRYQRGPVRLRPILSRVKLVLLAVRLRAARLLGFRLVWTVHQVLPHESVDRRLDRSAARLLARAANLLVVHDRWTAEQVASELAPPPKKLAVIPHGSYLGVYAQGRPRSEVRSELGLPADAFVFLCFGELRAYKEVEILLAAFSDVSNPNLRLVVAGNVKAPDVGATVRAASARDSRVVSRFGFVPESGVAEMFRACDAVVLSRGEPGTSGSLILALSMGRPVVAADVPTARELTGNGQAGWLFRPHDVSSLRAALETAGADASEASARGRRGLEIAEGLDWTEIAIEFDRLLSRIDG